VNLSGVRRGRSFGFGGTEERNFVKKYEEITRGRLRARIHVQSIEAGVCIFCPSEVSDRLYRHFLAKNISAEPPRGAMFCALYPVHEVIIALPSDKAQAEINDFVSGLPEICYERAV
jgi:hypothetical protein